MSTENVSVFVLQYLKCGQVVMMTAQLLNFVFWGGRYIKKEILTQGSFLDFRIRILRLLITNRTRACTNAPLMPIKTKT